MLASDYIKNFPILIFDMGNTFMYGGDRFDDSQNYEASYRLFGGEKLSNNELHQLVHYSYNTLLERYRDPIYYDNFISLRDFIETDENFSRLDKNEKDLIERVCAHHECGSISEECKLILKGLSNTHRLGLISNVWTYSKYYIDKLKKENVYEMFEVILYSSDHGCIKPSIKLFNKAIEYFNIDPSQMVFIGDNYKRDIVGPKNAGMKSILVTNGRTDGEIDGIKPDYMIEHIRELVSR